MGNQESERIITKQQQTGFDMNVLINVLKNMEKRINKCPESERKNKQKFPEYGRKN